jgi:uncharacterized protein YbaP (TraB family)
MKILSIALLPLLLTAQTAHAKAPAVHPALWKVSSKTATIYLFGSVHVLPKGVNWHTPALNKAEAEASTLYLEINDVDDHAKLQQEFQAVAVAPNLPPVLDRVRPEKRPGLKALFDTAKLPIDGLKPYKSWAVAITLGATLIKDLQYSADDGVEHGLTADFTAAHKPINGLETSAQQFGYFNQLSEKAQARFLESIVDDAPNVVRDTAKMIAAWETGNPQIIADAFDKDMKKEPELQRVLLHNRNANWSKWIINQLNGRGITLVAVGAGHLAGRDSVVAMLNAKGLKVSRVE